MKFFSVLIAALLLATQSVATSPARDSDGEVISNYSGVFRDSDGNVISVIQGVRYVHLGRPEGQYGVVRDSDGDVTSVTLNDAWLDYVKGAFEDDTDVRFIFAPACENCFVLPVAVENGVVAQYEAQEASSGGVTTQGEVFEVAHSGGQVFFRSVSTNRRIAVSFQDKAGRRLNPTAFELE